VSMYAGRVPKFITRLLVLVAVLLMPLGMAPADASQAHHAIAAAVPMKHCPDQAPSHAPKGALALCTMACAAAVPASSSPIEEPLTATADLAKPAPSQRLQGLQPETATPPPKLS